MRITGDGVWGPPKNRQEALAVLRRAIELGINFIDTAESYGPHVSELIAEALHPYPEDLVIATKGGFDRSGPNKWVVNARPQRLREELGRSASSDCPWENVVWRRRSRRRAPAGSPAPHWAKPAQIAPSGAAADPGRPTPREVARRSTARRSPREVAADIELSQEELEQLQ